MNEDQISNDRDDRGRRPGDTDSTSSGRPEQHACPLLRQPGRNHHQQSGRRPGSAGADGRAGARRVRHAGCHGPDFRPLGAQTGRMGAGRHLRPADVLQRSGAGADRPGELAARRIAQGGGRTGAGHGRTVAGRRHRLLQRDRPDHGPGRHRPGRRAGTEGSPSGSPGADSRLVAHTEL